MKIRHDPWRSQHPLADIPDAEVGLYEDDAGRRVIAGQATDFGTIERPEGDVLFQPGDFIVTESNAFDRPVPMPRETFGETYKKV